MLPRGLPVNIHRLLERCLDKDPKWRLQSIGEARIAIDETLSGKDSVSPASSPVKAATGTSPLQQPIWQRTLLWTTIAASTAAVPLAFFLFQRLSAPAERMQFAIPVPSEVSNMSLSGDGRMLAYVAPDDASGENMLYVQLIGSPNASLLAGTQGASYPFWSPDDAYAAFFSDGKLKKVAVAGGLPKRLPKPPPAGAEPGEFAESLSILLTPQAHYGE